MATHIAIQLYMTVYFLLVIYQFLFGICDIEIFCTSYDAYNSYKIFSILLNRKLGLYYKQQGFILPFYIPPPKIR